jgi:hypothetical protein
VAALAVVVIGVTLGFAIVAAGSDDGGTAAPRRPVDRAAFCRSWLEMTPLRVEEALTEDDGDNRLRAGRMHDVLEAGGTAPAELRRASRYVRRAVADASRGDRRRYDALDRQVATDDILAWAHERCGYTKVQVGYRDFAYEGLPPSLPAGPTSFEGVQEGAEPHVMQIYRVRDGVPGTPEEVLARARQESIPSLALARTAELIGFGAFTDFEGPPGHLLVDLRPGSYLVICPIPTGVNRDGVAPDRAKPHFDNGMVGSFTVT